MNFFKKKFTYLLNIIFLISVFIFFNSCEKKSISIEGKDVLIVGTNAEFYPFCFVEDGVIKGFDIDIAKKIAEKLNKKIVLKDLPFDSLIFEIQTNSVDFIAAGMTVTKERAKKVNFSIKYLNDDPLVYIYKKDIKNLDLTEKIIIVNQGYTADTYAEENFLKNKIIRLQNPIEAFMALSAKRGDVFISALSSVKKLLDKYPEYTYKVIPNADENCALMVGKKNIDLLQKINIILNEMIENKEIEKLKIKWKIDK